MESRLAGGPCPPWIAGDDNGGQGPPAKRKIAIVALLILAALSLTGCATNQAAKTQLNTGYADLDQHQYDQAIQAADQYLQKTPNGPGSAEAQYLKGRVLEERADQADHVGNTTEARTDLKEAGDCYKTGLLLNPPPVVEALLHAQLANVAYHFDDYGTAVREWQSAYPHLQTADSNAWVLYCIGLCQQRLGWFSQADRTFQMVRETYPDTPQSARAEKHIGVKGFYVQVGAFADSADAQRTIANLQMKGFQADKQLAGGKQMISVGPVPTYADAHAMKARLESEYPKAFIEP
jgi:outer membrane protein assembly factor BamD (BamD/ComL family)